MRSYLIELLPGLYHPFPEDSVLQDVYTRVIRRAARIVTKALPQQDGSRMKVLYSNTLGAMEIARKLEDKYPSLGRVWVERETSAQRLLNFITGKYHSEKFEFVVYHTHTFIGGQIRVLPVFRWPHMQTCFNACCLWPQYAAEDGWGLLIDGAEELNLLRPNGIGFAKIIDYQSNKRLCHCCGKVYNVRGKNVANWNI